MSPKTRNPLGWGYVEDAATESERRALRKALGLLVGSSGIEDTPAPHPDAIALPPSRVSIPSKLSGYVHNDPRERLLRAAGRSYLDLVDLRTNDVEFAPDAVATPSSIDELMYALEWADNAALAVIPFGGGSSVVGGVNPRVPPGFSGVLTVELQRMNRVLSISEQDLVVHAQAGILGPELQCALDAQGLALRHYPQSYLHSSLGGWVATRSAGHFSTGPTKIEDRVVGVDVVLSDGRHMETLPTPSSSIGPDPVRFWAGSEGAFGIITSAALRVYRKPQRKSAAEVRYPNFVQALEGARAIVQSGLRPAQLRVLDPAERMLSVVTSGGKGMAGAYLLVGFESSGLDVTGPLDEALRLARNTGGTVESPTAGTDPSAPAGEAAQAWRSTFFRQPYLRDVLIDWGILAETFETAVCWSKAVELYKAVREATMDAIRSECGTGGVTARTTHAYADGVSLYFSVFAPGKRGALREQWWRIKTAASEAIVRVGGTISHHHAMGRDHKAWAVAELPAAHRSALAAAKTSLDPRGAMNPGLWFPE